MYTTSHAAPSGLRGDLAYGELKHRLLTGEFGLGRRLGEERLAALCGMSRTPIREALMRLAAEGLVRRSSDGGYLPVAPDVTVIRHLYEVRIGLELQALRRPADAGRRHDSTQLEALRDEWASMVGEHHDPGVGFVVLDESFHVALADAAGNPVLVDLLIHVNERIRIVRMQDFLTADRIHETIAEHVGIVESLLRGHQSDAEQRFAAAREPFAERRRGAGAPGPGPHGRKRRRSAVTGRLARAEHHRRQIPAGAACVVSALEHPDPPGARGAPPVSRSIHDHLPGDRRALRPGRSPARSAPRRKGHHQAFRRPRRQRRRGHHRRSRARSTRSSARTGPARAP